MPDKELKLKVAEAIQDDVNKGIVRIDSSLLNNIVIRPGDIVELEGERKTVAIADRAYPGDIGLNIVRMDGIIRKNSKTGIGEIIKVRKADVKEGKKVTIAPARKGIVMRASPEIFKQGLLGRAVSKGDIVSLGGTRRRRSTMMESPFYEDVFSLLDESAMGFGFGDIKFVVVDTNPKQHILITEQTEVIFNPEAVEVKEELVPEVTYEDIGGLNEEVKKVREMVELPLKHPEIFERLGIEAPKGVLLHGAPGTGKTLLAKAVANETNSHFILINGPEIMSKYYGQSEENLRKRFEEAEKNAPSIVFIDEI
ncbi:MAG TPA: AAA family ATPase, partial [Candidatus Woesearchaeota archaeon]|nr:AAA family ATPase [Candidatus Woesearchaeota archaeon]